jgi:phospholipid/cholesterol/gamma-HCH transport system permease protein
MKTAASMQDRAGVFERFGGFLIDTTVGVCHCVGEYCATLGQGLMIGNWRRTMRREFGRTLYQTGVLAIPAVLVASLLVAAGLVLQIIYWLDYAGQENRIGEFLVLVLVRQIAPVTCALILIGRNGAAIVDDIGQLQASGHMRLLHSHGIDPSMLITVPRAFAMALACFLLTMLFMHTALWGGFIVAALAGLSNLSALAFVEDVLGNMTLSDHLLLIVKPLLTGYTIGWLSIWYGLQVQPGVLGIRNILPRAFVVSLLATFAISGLLELVL